MSGVYLPRPGFVASALVVLGLVLAGCGGGTGSAPTAPSTSATPAAGGASGSPAGGGASPPVSGPGSASVEAEIEVEGPVTAASPPETCPTRTLTVAGLVPAQLTPGTEFEGVTCQGLTVGTGVEVKGLSFNGDLPAIEVELKAPGAAEFKVEGPVGSVSGTCPTVGVTVVGFPFTVGPFTRVRDLPGGCAALRPGLAVEARGPLTAFPPPAAELRPED